MAQRLESHALAVEMLCRLATDRQIKDRLMLDYALTRSQATSVLRAAYKSIRATVDEAVPEKRARMVSELRQLFRDAHGAKKFDVCLKVLDKLAEVEAVISPTRVVEEDAWSGKTDAELDHYAVHGCWPDEIRSTAQEQAPPPPTENTPLARLLGGNLH